MRLSSFGDIINALPCAHALRRAYPEAFIGWVADRNFASLLEPITAIDRVFPLPLPNGRSWTAADRRRLPQLAATTVAFVRTLREQRFDVCLDLQGLLRSALIGWLAHVPRRLGFEDERREGAARFVTEFVTPAQGHASTRFLSMAEHLGASAEPREYGRLFTDRDAATAAALLAPLEDRVPVAIVPVCSHPMRNWEPEKFALLIEQLERRHGIPAVLVGAPADTDSAAAIAGQCVNSPVNAVGRTSIGELAALLERCRLVVTGDTGPMHLAVAVGTPVVALFGPSNPEITGPYGAGSGESATHRVVREPFPCQPCYRRPTCATGRDCMAALQPERVLAEIEDLLGVEPATGVRS